MTKPTYEIDGEYAILSTEIPSEWLRSDSIVTLDDWE
jgi:hypothetical protein